MSRKPGHVPSYRLHKPSGRARVIIDGEHIYLGLYGSPESHERYARLIAERAVGKQNGKARQNGETNGAPSCGCMATRRLGTLARSP
jgi:hypothetical protein